MANSEMFKSSWWLNLVSMGYYRSSEGWMMAHLGLMRLRFVWPPRMRPHYTGHCLTTLTAKLNWLTWYQRWKRELGNIYNGNHIFCNLKKSRFHLWPITITWFRHVAKVKTTRMLVCWGIFHIVTRVCLLRTERLSKVVMVTNATDPIILGIVEIHGRCSTRQIHVFDSYAPEK